MKALPFQPGGRLTCARMSGAVLSTGWIATDALQYSPIVAVAATVVVVTSAPLVGRPISDAGMDVPLSSAHVLASAARPGAARTKSAIASTRRMPRPSRIVLMSGPPACGGDTAPSHPPQ